MISLKLREVREREDLFREAAHELLRTHGYRGLTMDRIEEGTECSKGAVSHRFRRTEEFITAILHL